ncbi:hypothetical protein HYDPIDRAFT_24308 [Hydnomerulius pinastri MD-312]|nr:hypothetical protein HYDPIDRAFT_24308 [Hydnomerulius pinastri MD-312]
MESSEADIKPMFLIDELTGAHSPCMPITDSTGPSAKFKQSRYEDVWPEDVHAAFMEAVSLYPPMGKRRLKYYRVAVDENTSPESTRVKSFGRCQLIQSYILDKTGKNRSRKQVSSHLQRLKKLHKDNPAMRALFSEPSQLSSEYHGPGQATDAVDPQDILNGFSTSTNSLKSEFDSSFSLQSTASGAESSFAYLSETSSSSVAFRMLDSSMIIHDPSSFAFNQEKLPSQEGQMGAVLPAGSDHSYDVHNGALFKDSMGGPYQPSPAFNTSAFSMSMRRLASKLPALGRQLDLPPPAYSSRTVCSPGCQSTHQLVAHDGSNYTLVDLPCNFPLTPTEQVLHTPLQPPQIMRHDRRRLAPDLERSWTWPQNPDVSYSPLGPSASRASGAGGSYYEQPLLDQYASYPASYPLTRDHSPGCYSSSSSESDGSCLARRLSYSYAPSPLSVMKTVPGGSMLLPNLPMPEPSEEHLASPLIIKPTPLYPVAYTHSESSTPEIPSNSPF